MTREQYLSKRNQLMSDAKGFLDAGDLVQFNAKKNLVEELDAQYEDEATAQANYAALQGAAVVPGALQNLGGNSGSGAAEDPYSSNEYMEAFMNFACRGTPIPARFLNAAATTTSESAGAAIPKVLLKEIIRTLRESGVIFQQLRHLNIQGGVDIPVADLMPAAHWVGESAASDDQEVKSSSSVSFRYYGLECKIAQSILVSVVAIEEFQELFVELSCEAIMVALEKGVFKGTGEGQMLGVCNDKRVTNVVSLTAAEFSSYSAWKKKVFSKIKKRYQRGRFYMAQGTFEGQIDGMVDEGGQPVARINYGIADDPQYRFGGKTVETVEDDVLTPYESAEAGEVVAVYMNPKSYIINSNMTMTVVQWTDHDNNKKKTKVMLICDGKVGDVGGVILIKKGS